MKEFNEPKYIDVSTIREEFSKYKLENGLTFKLKIPLVAIKEEWDKSDVDKNTLISNGITCVISYVDTPHNFNTVDLQTVDSTSKHKVTKKLRIIQRHEVTNIYETDKGFIILDVHLKEIFATDKKDLKGNPLLQQSYDVAIVFMKKPTHDN